MCIARDSKGGEGRQDIQVSSRVAMSAVSLAGLATIMLAAVGLGLQGSLGEHYEPWAFDSSFTFPRWSLPLTADQLHVSSASPNFPTNHRRNDTTYTMDTLILHDASCGYLGQNLTTGRLEEFPCTKWDFDTSTFSSTVTSELRTAEDDRHLDNILHGIGSHLPVAAFTGIPARFPFPTWHNAALFSDHSIYVYWHRKNIAAIIKEKFSPMAPLVIHWDGKMMTNIMEKDVVDRLPILLSAEETSLKAVCDFVIKVYLKAWFLAHMPQFGPAIDLWLLKELNKYHTIHPKISAAALKKFQVHLWYLSERLIPLALFDDSGSLTLEDKGVMAHKMLQPTKDMNPPKRVVVHTSDIQEKKISSFVSGQSRAFFRIMGLEDSFLMKTPESWESDDAFQRAN
ncbi:hypothetical protein GWK47_000878 [Chionoecetes opilio]|uniref:Uncharacterized protein n=1 Tax=Chionoecetes opilio TaxID=41210 RepID=A0A8J5CQ98_CHIOP|nr:hypothetical protein GWK47_020985 [Chionoecetes opilio]KAG0717076.1 hypothetical protein GWK47_000878 [Chionoecetes opilio]